MTIFENVQDLLYTYIIPHGYSISEVAVDLISLCASLFLVSLPFIFIYRIIKLLGGR